MKIKSKGAELLKKLKGNGDDKKAGEKGDDKKDLKIKELLEKLKKLESKGEKGEEAAAPEAAGEPAPAAPPAMAPTPAAPGQDALAQLLELLKQSGMGMNPMDMLGGGMNGLGGMMGQGGGAGMGSSFIPQGAMFQQPGFLG